MHAAPTHSTPRARLIFPALLGFVAGTAGQLQQPGLLAWPVYASFVLLACVLYAWTATRSIASLYRSALMALALAVLAFGVTGLRASIHAGQALDANLEGRDVAVTGVIAAMPQRSETGLRFRLDVESAQQQGQTVRLPPRLYLAWYADRFAGGDADLGDVLQRKPAAVRPLPAKALCIMPVL